jgi:pyruvate dehydrogenase E2 component (dihydrolipoamide acetyltransferase)
MPRLSDSMEEGTIVAWLVEDGALVSQGDEIVEIESDKATLAYPAETSGVLRIAVATGTAAAPGTRIARIDVNGDRSVPVSVPAPADGTAEGEAAPTPTTGAKTTDGAAREANGAAGAAPSASATDAAPSATGTTDRDSRSAAAAPSPATSPTASAPTGVRFREPSRIERLVTKRMVQSRTEIPDFAVTVEIDMSACIALRADLKRVGGKRVPSVNDLIVKACALTLRDHPRVNSAWVDEQVAEYEHVNVGVAVATDDEQLVVPVIADADRLTLGQLADRSRELTKRARAGKITPAELSGGTFTVSNLGMLGVAHFSAIITPGQGAILAVGSTVSKFVPVDGQPVARPVLTATLCSDHRVIYGAHAAAFLDRLRTYLEHPGSLAL